MRLTRVLLMAACMFAAHMSWAVAKEVVVPGGAANAGQSISFTTGTGEAVPVEVREDGDDLIVTVLFEGDASSGSLSVGRRDYAIPGGNQPYTVPVPFRPSTPGTDPSSLIPGGPSIAIGWLGGGDTEWGGFTSHAVELTGDGEFAVVGSDDSVSTDGVSVTAQLPTGIGLVSLGYRQYDGDDSYGQLIPAGTGQFAIVNDNFLNDDPLGSTGACCDTGIWSQNELDIEYERIDLEFAWPCSWDWPGDGVFLPHIGLTLGSMEISQRSFDAFVSPGLEGVNTRGDVEFDNDFYQLRFGGDYTLPFNDRWGAQLRLGLGISHSDVSIDMAQDVTVFTPAGTTRVRDSESDTALSVYGGVGIYANLTSSLRADVGYYFDYEQTADPDINNTGDDLFVRNQTSAIDLQSGYNDGFQARLRWTIGGQ